MVVQYALLRWARGEEAGAEATWRRYFPRDFTSWWVILAAAIAAAHTCPRCPGCDEPYHLCPVCGAVLTH